MPRDRKKRNRDEKFWHKSAVTGQAMQLGHIIAGIFSVSWNFLGDASKNLGSWKQKILGTYEEALERRLQRKTARKCRHGTFGDWKTSVPHLRKVKNVISYIQ